MFGVFAKSVEREKELKFKIIQIRAGNNIRRRALFLKNLREVMIVSCLNTFWFSKPFYS